MVPYVDIAFGLFLQSLFPKDYTVVWSPPDLSREALARLQNNQGNASVGIPGLTYCRTSCIKNKRAASIPQAHDGFLAGAGPTPAHGEPTTFDTIKYIRVLAEYSVVGWTKSKSDRDAMERILWFCDIYNGINFQFQGPNFSIENDFAFEGDDPNYREIPDEKSKRVLWWGIEKKFIATTQWVETGSVPEITSVSVEFENYFSGIPLSDSIKEYFTVVPR
jgi:hypothetical protein